MLIFLKLLGIDLPIFPIHLTVHLPCLPPSQDGVRNREKAMATYFSNLGRKTTINLSNVPWLCLLIWLIKTENITCERAKHRRKKIRDQSTNISRVFSRESYSAGNLPPWSPLVNVIVIHPLILPRANYTGEIRIT